MWRIWSPNSRAFSGEPSERSERPVPACFWTVRPVLRPERNLGTRGRRVRWNAMLGPPLPNGRITGLVKNRQNDNEVL
jgi:hypothetical protein